MQFFIDVDISTNQPLTPEGFLLCRSLPVARVGQQIYHTSKIPVLVPNGDGLIVIERDPVDVFDPDSIASFEGKPITDDHPSEDVTPRSWRSLALGHMQNVRRGTGRDSDVLLADRCLGEHCGDARRSLGFRPSIGMSICRLRPASDAR